MRRKRNLFWLILFFLLATGIVAELSLKPMLLPYADEYAKAYLTETMEQAVLETLSTQSYDNIVRLEKDSAGKLVAITTDTLSANRLKAEMSLLVLQKLTGPDAGQLKIPLGTLLEGNVFNNLGPDVTVQIRPVGSVQTNLIQTFTAAGINQTRHQISLRVSATVQIAAFRELYKTEIAGEFLLAETLIVGDVPQYYRG